jgi:hypothetical protein
MPASKADTIEVENFTSPGSLRRVDAGKYAAMRQAFLKILPSAAPGLTPAEILKRVLAHLPQDLFPGGAKAGWWVKCVQLDLEAKGVIARAKTPPVQLRKT